MIQYISKAVWALPARAKDAVPVRGSGRRRNRDGELDWKDSAIEKEILRKEAASRGIKE